MPLDSASESPAKPFVKWVGGKGRLTADLLRYAPKEFNNYHEPFLGGGALFFALGPFPGKAFLSDTNQRLIQTFKGVRDDPDKVVRRLKLHEKKHGKKYFLGLRDQAPDGRAAWVMAAWFIYLNRVCFNGLYRVNARDAFNVPFGDYASPKIVDPEGIASASRVLQRARLNTRDFETSRKSIGEGDFVYLDPPFLPRSKTSNFTSYAPGGFSFADHERLRDFALECKARGAAVVVSGSDVEATRDLYGPRFSLAQVMTRRSVSRKADGRGPIPELIIT